jgi:MoaA/NifB/PqqE/SkfB family radical SAM enzyme
VERLFIELTNVCNRHCLHCIRNQADSPGFLPMSLAREILDQARTLGFRRIALTGGEVALYPYLEEFLTLVVEYGFSFNLVTNGHRFRENLLPLLSSTKFRENLTEVCFSLDGARSETHDALRGAGSFREVVEAATLCQFKEIPVSFKSVITNFNKEELTELALLGATLESRDHSFIQLVPTPRSIREGVILPPDEVGERLSWISGSLAKMLRSKITIEAFGPRTPLFSCGNIQRAVYVDFQGNLVLCCNLSHVTREEGQPSVFGPEWLADLKEVTLQEGLVRQYHAVARLMEARLGDQHRLGHLTLDPCYWCFQHFGKFEWLREFPESPWSYGLLEMERSYAGV